VSTNITKKGKDKKSTELHPSTVIINKIQREKSREAVRQVLSWLSKTFPKAFDVDGAIRPLKVGIFDDILDYAEKNDGLPFSKSKLRKALVVFTRRMEYLTCVKMKDIRIDLNGEEIETVSDEAAQIAVQNIKKNIEKTIRARRKTTTPRPVARKAVPPKRRFSHPAQNGGYQNNPYREPRENSSYYPNSDAQPTVATIKVKKRFSPQNTEQNTYHLTTEKNFNTPEKNYNSASYNTEASTVERLKAKLGLTKRRERFDYED
jgi:ProP effector